MTYSPVELPAARHLSSPASSRIMRSGDAEATKPVIHPDSDRAYRRKRRVAALLTVTVVVTVLTLLGALIML